MKREFNAFCAAHFVADRNFNAIKNSALSRKKEGQHSNDDILHLLNNVKSSTKIHILSK